MIERLTATVLIPDLGYLGYSVGSQGLVIATYFHNSRANAEYSLNQMHTDMSSGNNPGIDIDRKWWDWAFNEFFTGGETAQNPSLVKLDSRPWTPFQKRVFETLRDNVLWGDTISYGELAQLAGSPGAARAVGTAMASNTGGPFIPCHRVIASGGRLGGYSGSGGLILKRKLLDLERDKKPITSLDPKHP